MSGGRLSIGIRVGEKLFEDVFEVSVRASGFETNEHIAQGLEALARQIRKEVAAMRAARGGGGGDEGPDIRAGRGAGRRHYTERGQLDPAT